MLSSPHKSSDSSVTQAQVLQEQGNIAQRCLVVETINLNPNKKQGEEIGIEVHGGQAPDASPLARSAKPNA